MKAWNKPVRIALLKEPWWGITNWLVGTCAFPWSPWVQISIGRLNIQIKWYVIVALAITASFFLGTLF